MDTMILHHTPPIMASKARLDAIYDIQPNWRFVGEISLRNPDGEWTEIPMMVFADDAFGAFYSYHYCGSTKRWRSHRLTNFNPNVIGLVTEYKGETYFTMSRFFHDTVTAPGGPTFHGGRLSIITDTPIRGIAKLDINTNIVRYNDTYYRVKRA